MINKQIYEGSPTTVWQLGGVLYDMLVGRKRFNTQLFLLDESTFFHDLKELTVTDGDKNISAFDELLVGGWCFSANICVHFLLSLPECPQIVLERQLKGAFDPR